MIIYTPRIIISICLQRELTLVNHLMDAKKTLKPHPFHIIAKPVGASCNLNCTYCYYISKQHLYPNKAPRMSDTILDEYICQFIDSQWINEVTFSWQGGEPTLLGIPFFQAAIELQEKYRKPGMVINNSLQTNGTKLNDAWGRFFHKNGFLIGVSLDGPRQFHDIYRRTKDGQPTFSKVIEGISLLKDHQIEFNILTCVHAVNADDPLDVYRFLRDDVGATFIQFIPIVERYNQIGFQEGKKVTKLSVTAKQYGKFLIEIFDEWVQHDVGRVFVQIFDVALGHWLAQRAGLCIFDETCGSCLALEHNGDLYSCDHYVEPKFLLGNIMETPLSDMVYSERQYKFGKDKQKNLPQFCLECDVQFACNGGCPKNRVLNTSHGENGLNYLCEGYKAFYKHVDRSMNIMACLIHNNRSPAEIMRVIKKEDNK